MSTYQEALDEHTPSNWGILSNSNGNIVARNNKTGRSFEGTVAAFNSYAKIKVSPPKAPIYDIQTGIPYNKVVTHSTLHLYVRQNGQNGDGTSDTDESAFSTVENALAYVSRNFILSGDMGWVLNTPDLLIEISGAYTSNAIENWPTPEVMCGKWPTIVIKSVSSELVKFNSRCQVWGGSGAAGFVINGGDFASISANCLNVDLYVSGITLRGYLSVHDTAISVGNTLLKGSARFQSTNNSDLGFWDAVTELDATLSFGENISASEMFYASGSSRVFLSGGVSFNTNGFTYTGARAKIEMNSIITAPTGDTEKTFIPATGAVQEITGGKYYI